MTVHVTIPATSKLGPYRNLQSLTSVIRLVLDAARNLSPRWSKHNLLAANAGKCMFYWWLRAPASGVR